MTDAAAAVTTTQADLVDQAEGKESEVQTTQAAGEGGTGADPSPDKGGAEESSTREQSGNRLQDRFNELTAKQRAAERERDEALRRVAELEQAKAAEAAQPEPFDVSKLEKSEADFEYDAARWQAYVSQQMAQHTAKAAADSAVAAVRNETENQRAEAERLARYQGFEDRRAEYEKEVPDFAEKVYSENFAYTPDMHEVIADMDNGPAVMYHLASNLQEAESIARMPPIPQAMELARLQDRLAAEAAQVRRDTSQAPAPTRGIDGAGESAPVDPTSPESDNVSDAEWMRRRNEQIARRRSKK